MNCLIGRREVLSFVMRLHSQSRESPGLRFPEILQASVAWVSSAVSVLPTWSYRRLLIADWYYNCGTNMKLTRIRDAIHFGLFEPQIDITGVASCPAQPKMSAQ